MESVECVCVKNKEGEGAKKKRVGEKKLSRPLCGSVFLPTSFLPTLSTAAWSFITQGGTRTRRINSMNGINRMLLTTDRGYLDLLKLLRSFLSVENEHHSNEQLGKSIES